MPGNAIVIKPEVTFSSEPINPTVGRVWNEKTQSLQTVPWNSMQQTVPGLEMITSQSNSLSTEEHRARVTNSEELSLVKSKCNITPESVRDENKVAFSVEQVPSVTNGLQLESHTDTDQFQVHFPGQDVPLSNPLPKKTSVQSNENTSVYFKPRIVTATPRDISLSPMPSSYASSAPQCGIVHSACACCKEGAPPCPFRSPKQSTGTQYDIEPSKIFWQLGDINL